MVKNLPAMQERQEMQFPSPCRKIPWRRKWQPTPVFLPGTSHGQRSLTGYTPRGCKESQLTEVTQHTHTIGAKKERIRNKLRKSPSLHFQLTSILTATMSTFTNMHTNTFTQILDPSGRNQAGSIVTVCLWPLAAWIHIMFPGVCFYAFNSFTSPLTGFLCISPFMCVHVSMCVFGVRFFLK